MPLESVPPDSRPMLRKGLLSVTWPLLVSLSFSLSLHFVDAFFLSRVSDEAAAAAGAVLPVLGAALVLFVAVSQAGCSVAAQLLGARRLNDVPPTYLALVAFNVAVGFATSAGFVLFRHRIPVFLGLPAGAAEQASTYLAILGGFQFLKALQLAYGAILNSRGATKWVLAEAVLTNVSNVALNVAFQSGLFGLPYLGVAGVAIATVASLAVGLAFTVCSVRYGLGVRLPWRTTALRDLRHRLRPILRIGLPSALEPVAYQSAQMMVNALVISFGTVSLTARVYVFNLYLVTTMLWAIAFGTGTQILIAHRVGAGSYDQANAELLRGLAFGVLGNLALCALLAVLHPWLLGLLTDDPRVHAVAHPVFFIAPLVEAGRAMNIVAGGALRSSGDARFTSVVGMLFMWGLGLPAVYSLGGWLGLGLTGVWMGMAVDEITRGSINFLRWRRGRWKELGVVSQRGA